MNVNEYIKAWLDIENEKADGIYYKIYLYLSIYKSIVGMIIVRMHCCIYTYTHLR